MWFCVLDKPCFAVRGWLIKGIKGGLLWWLKGLLAGVIAVVFAPLQSV